MGPQDSRAKRPGVLLGMAALITAATVSSAGELTVAVSGVTQSNGSVVIALFSREAGFPRELHRADFTKSVTTTDPKFTFRNLPASKYAVLTYHDLNENGTLDKSFVGMPTEPLGLSRYQTIGMSNRPNFQKALVDISETSEVTVPLIRVGK